MYMFYAQCLANFARWLHPYHKRKYEVLVKDIVLKSIKYELGPLYMPDIWKTV